VQRVHLVLAIEAGHELVRAREFSGLDLAMISASSPAFACERICASRPAGRRSASPHPGVKGILDVAMRALACLVRRGAASLACRQDLCRRTPCGKPGRPA
jgi:hypothetical protein